MVEPTNSADGRRFPRLRTSCGIRYKPVKADGILGDAAKAFTVNISGGGVCLETDEGLPAGSLLAVELDLPDYDCPIVSLGRVAWCRPDASGKFEIGLEFWWVGWGDDSAQKTVSDHIKNSLER